MKINAVIIFKLRFRWLSVAPISRNGPQLGIYVMHTVYTLKAFFSIYLLYCTVKTDVIFEKKSQTRQFSRAIFEQSL